MKAGKSQLVWEALCSSKGWVTTTEISEVTKTSKPYVLRLLREWSESGFAKVHHEYIVGAGAGRGSPNRAVYKPMKNPPEIAPAIHSFKNGNGAYLTTSDMTANEFVSIRKRLGLSTEAMGRALGWTGSRQTANRNIRKFENGDKPISTDIAAKARAL